MSASTLEQAKAVDLPATVRPSAEEFLENGGGPGRDSLVREELCAYLKGCFGRFHPDHLAQQTEVVDVASPGCQRLHREDVTW
jgi:hypothetical protein